MIVYFQTDTYQLDLTKRAISYLEENNMFFDISRKDFTLPFSLKLHEEDAVKIGLANYNSVSDFKRKTHGKLVLFNDFTRAYIVVNQIKGPRAELTLYAGDDILEVNDKYLPDLRWPTINTTSLIEHAKETISKSWPETSHVFPCVWRPEIKDIKHYDAFESYVNNFDGTDYLENVILGATPGQLNFLYRINGTLPATQQLQISCNGDWQISSTSSWVTFSVSSGSGDANVDVGIDPAGLIENIYSADIVVTSKSVSVTTKAGLAISGETGSPNYTLPLSDPPDPDSTRVF